MLDKEQLRFIVFCIEKLIKKLNITSKEAYQLITKDKDVIEGYIKPFYKDLQTQNDEYIINELIELLKRKGVL